MNVASRRTTSSLLGSRPVEDRWAGEQHDTPLGQHEVVDHGWRRQGNWKGPRKIAGRVDLVKLDDRLLRRVCERKQRPGLRMSAVMRAESDRLVGARLPFAGGVEFHGHFIARRRLVEGEQTAAMVKYAAEGAILEWTGMAARTDKRRIDGHRMRKATVDCTSSATLGSGGTSRHIWRTGGSDQPPTRVESNLQLQLHSSCWFHPDGGSRGEASSCFRREAAASGINTKGRPVRPFTAGEPRCGRPICDQRDGAIFAGHGLSNTFTLVSS
jgi:hypothetical protein